LRQQATGGAAARAVRFRQRPADPVTAAVSFDWNADAFQNRFTTQLRSFDSFNPFMPQARVPHPHQMPVKILCTRESLDYRAVKRIITSFK